MIRPTRNATVDANTTVKSVKRRMTVFRFQLPASSLQQALCPFHFQ
jgi:hypothetical protein